MADACRGPTTKRVVPIVAPHPPTRLLTAIWLWVPEKFSKTGRAQKRDHNRERLAANPWRGQYKGIYTLLTPLHPPKPPCICGRGSNRQQPHAAQEHESRKAGQAHPEGFVDPLQSQQLGPDIGGPFPSHGHITVHCGNRCSPGMAPISMGSVKPTDIDKGTTFACCSAALCGWPLSKIDCLGQLVQPWQPMPGRTSPNSSVVSWHSRNVVGCGVSLPPMNAQ